MGDGITSTCLSLRRTWEEKAVSAEWGVSPHVFWWERLGEWKLVGAVPLDA